MKNQFPDGMWPVMVTPFSRDGEIDYEALAVMVDWYIESGSAGLFATCQSSEIFFLSLAERVRLTRFIKERADGRVPVIASGHVSYSITEQIAELSAISGTGVDAVILISNRLAREDESDEIFLSNLQRLTQALPESLPLGFYECPYPYKRVLSPKIVRHCAESGRFYFLKDTSCSVADITEKLSIIKGSNMRLYNANTATLLESLKLGAAGYSGVMANYHPRLYAWLLENWRSKPQSAEFLSDFLTISSFIEMKNYPASAKCYLALEGLPLGCATRKDTKNHISDTEMLELRQLKHASDAILSRLSDLGD